MKRIGLARLVLATSAAFALPISAAELSGSVRGPDGAPVTAALVAAVAPNAPRPTATVSTDAAGAYRFAELPAGRYGITVTAEGFEASYRPPVTVADGVQARADVTLGKGGSLLAGVVTDADGKVVRARVLAARIGPEEADLFVGETDAAGRFSLILPGAKYMVTFIAGAFEPEELSADVPSAKLLSVRLVSSDAAHDQAPQPVLAAVRAAAIPLASVEAGHGFRDMEPLRAVVGPARIVALGEATHGTREFFQLKHRMLEFLVSEMGFTVFAIEANWPEGLAVDEFVQSGKGDPAKALAGMYFWTWNTEEVLDLIKWMRRWNEDASHVRKVRFAGVDMQFPPVAARAVLAYLAPLDPEWAKALSASFDVLMAADPRGALSGRDATGRDALRKSIADLGERMDARHVEFAKKTSEVDWRLARQHARILSQFEEMVRNPAENVRDRAMAENAAWVLAHAGPGARMVLWAHNGHVSRDATSAMGVSMGAHLAHSFGKDLVVFGFAFDEGSFQAIGKGSLRNFTVSPAPMGSADAMLRATGLPLYALDLRRIPRDSPAGKWLGARRKTRSVGSMYDEAAADQSFARQVLPAQYDALLFVAKTTAARPNPPTATANSVKRPPPAPAAVNLGFEEGPPAGEPAGWTIPKQSREDGWTVTVSEEQPRDGRFAARIARPRTDAPRVFGNVMQRIDATPWRGKRILLRAAVRVEGGPAALWLRVDRPGGAMGFFDNMGDRPIREPEWRFYEIAGEVAADAEAVAFGLMLQTGGTAFLDAVSLTEAPAK